MTRMHSKQFNLAEIKQASKCLELISCSRGACDCLNALDRRTQRSMVNRSYTKGTTIQCPGDQIPYVSAVISGVASLSKILEDGRRQIIGLVHPNDFLAHPSYPVARWHIEALTDVRVCGIERSAFDKILEVSPRLQARILDIAQTELGMAREFMVMLGKKNARERICSFVVYLVNRQHNSNGTTEGIASSKYIDLSISRYHVADFLGLTMETVSRQFSALSADHVLEFLGRNTVYIPDFRVLLMESGDDCDGAVIA